MFRRIDFPSTSDNGGGGGLFHWIQQTELLTDRVELGLPDPPFPTLYLKTKEGP
jgi:hypothetical protein